MLLRKLLVLMMFTSFLVKASSYTVSGFVFDKKTKEPIIGATIYSEKEEKGALTNVSGFFSISLDSTQNTLVCEFLGYQDAVQVVNELATVNFYLSRASELVDEVNIDIGSHKASGEDIGTVDIPVDQLKNIQILGETDPLKIVQLTPGVKSGGEGTPGLFVRGSSSDHNLYLLDGATIYNPFHLFGVYSVVNSDVLSSFKIVKGGFNPEYGGRLASVVEMNMKEGQKNKFGGKGTVGLLMSKIMLESPIHKKSSIFVSGRRTYGHHLAKPFVEATKYANFYFYDFYSKATIHVNDNNKIFVSGSYSNDAFTMNDGVEVDPWFKVNINWKNITSSVKWNSVLNSKTFVNTSVVYSRYVLNNNIWDKEYVSGTSSGETEFYDLLYSSRIEDISLQSNITYYASSKHQLKAGIQLTKHAFSPNAVVLKNQLVADNKNEVNSVFADEGALYVQDKYSISKVVYLNYGIRASYFNSDHPVVNFEPRVAAKIKLNSQQVIEASYTVMNQYSHLLATKGVGFPTDMWVASTSELPGQQSIQYSLGYSYLFPKHNALITVDAYYKDMSNTLTFKEGTTFMQNEDVNSISSSDLNWEENVTQGVSTASGVELMVHKKKGKLNGWIGYDLSFSTSQFDEVNLGRKFYNRYDRRHGINVVAVYNLNNRIQFSLNWTYRTGSPITVANSSYLSYSGQPLPGGVGGNNSTTNPVLYYSGINNYRTPAYHRLDLGVSISKNYKKITTKLNLGVYNVYNRKNVYFYFVSPSLVGQPTVKQVSLIPIIPNLNYEITF